MGTDGASDGVESSVNRFALRLAQMSRTLSQNNKIEQLREPGFIFEAAVGLETSAAETDQLSRAVA
jgi:hypothetical protein